MNPLCGAVDEVPFLSTICDLPAGHEGEHHHIDAMVWVEKNYELNPELIERDRENRKIAVARYHKLLAEGRGGA